MLSRAPESSRKRRREEVVESTLPQQYVAEGSPLTFEVEQENSILLEAIESISSEDKKNRLQVSPFKLFKIFLSLEIFKIKKVRYNYRPY